MIQNMIEYTREVLGHAPRVHGNGFIQLDLSEHARLHVWGHPSIPRQKVSSQVHDHMFEFSSLILRGMLVNVLYEIAVSTNGNFHKYHAQVRKGHDTVLVRSDLALYQMIERERHTHIVGDAYSMVPGDFHESVPLGLTVTIILKKGKTLAQGGPSPTVMVPAHLTPDNDFDRHSIPPDKLWRIIAEAVK